MPRFVNILLNNELIAMPLAFTDSDLWAILAPHSWAVAPIVWRAGAGGSGLVAPKLSAKAEASERRLACRAVVPQRGGGGFHAFNLLRDSHAPSFCVGTPRALVGLRGSAAVGLEVHPNAAQDSAMSSKQPTLSR